MNTWECGTPRSTSNAFSILYQPRAIADSKTAPKKRGQAFSPEEVTLKAAQHGVQVGDLRAWGAVFTQAAREGHITRSTELFSRTTSNGSVRPGWIGC